MSDADDHGDRPEIVDRINCGDTLVATRALLELTCFEEDVAWLEEFLLRQARESSDGNVRALAVTCIGHSARINGTVTSDSVFRSLRQFLADPELYMRAFNAVDDITAFTGRHWLSAPGAMLQLSAMKVRLRMGELRYWMG
jgi:hypothetical protein